MNPPPARKPPDLTAILEEKAKVLTSFVSASESLLACLAGGTLESLPAVLENRQKLARSIENIDREIDAALRELPAGGQDAATSRVLQLFRSRLERLLRTSAELEDQCLKAAECQRDRTKKEISDLQQGRKAARQYLQRGAAQPRFMDLKK